MYDPTDAVGRLLLNVLAMVAEFESNLIRLRTREGMKVAKAKGQLRGKQPKLTAARWHTWSPSCTAASTAPPRSLNSSGSSHVRCAGLGASAGAESRGPRAGVSPADHSSVHRLIRSEQPLRPGRRSCYGAAPVIPPLGMAVCGSDSVARIAK